MSDLEIEVKGSEVKAGEQQQSRVGGGLGHRRCNMSLNNAGIQVLVQMVCFRCR
jgi:hypothetical protein